MVKHQVRLTGLTIVVAAVPLILGCMAHTSIHSRVSPESAGKHFRVLFVDALFADLGLQEACEEKIREELSVNGVDCVLAHEAIFPGQALSDAEYAHLFDSLGVDALLLVCPGTAGTSESYIPQSTTSKTDGSVTPDYTGGYRFSARTRTTTSGGYTVDKPWATFSAELYDVSSGKMCWYATGNTGGNAFANFTTVVRSMGGKVVVKMKQDRVLAPK
ncbi:MAG: hypothetical protein AB1644_06925 [Candidatus Zixiibacteriota bacterium]